MPTYLDKFSVASIYLKMPKRLSIEPHLSLAELYQFRLHRNDKKTAESAESADERRGRGNLYHSDINGNDMMSLMLTLLFWILLK